MRKAQTLKTKYSARFKNLCVVAEILENHLKDNLASEKRIDRISVRAKSIKSFCDKAAKKEQDKLKYSDPLNQIQDQLGARIITFYPADIERISKIVEEYYRPIEKRNVIPETEREFGYEGKHYILFVPDAVLLSKGNDGNCPKFFELQIRTLFQHAWSEAEHDLGYKPNRPLASEDMRKMAFTAAQAWGADTIFQELFVRFGSKKQRPRS